MNKDFNKQEMIAFAKQITSKLSNEDLKMYFNKRDNNFLFEIIENLRYFNEDKADDFFEYCNCKEWYPTGYHARYMDDYLMTMKTILHLNKTLTVEELNQMAWCELCSDYNFTEILEGYY